MTLSRRVLAPGIVCVALAGCAADDGAPTDAGPRPDPAAGETVEMPLEMRTLSWREYAAQAGPPTDAELEAWATSDLPHVERPNKTMRRYVDKRVFETRYAGATDDELAAARERVNEQLLPFRRRVTDHYLASGAADTDPPAPGDEEAASARERERSRSGLYLVSRSQPDRDGGMVRLRGAIPWSPYVALYDLSDELRWLIGEQSRRAREADTAAR